MSRWVTRIVGAVLLVGTGVHGVAWLVRSLVAQGLDRSEKVVSIVAAPLSIVIGGIGLWLGWRTIRQGGAAAGPGRTQRASRHSGRNDLPRRAWAAFAVLLGLGVNVALFRVNLPDRLPELPNEVRVGVSGIHPRWSKANSGQAVGSALGFDIDLVNFLRRRFSGHTWRIVQVTPADREAFLVTGKADLIIANYSMEGSSQAYPGRGLQRGDVIDFAGPYFYDRSGIMRHPLKISQSERIPSEKVCVGAGTTAVHYIQNNPNFDADKVKIMDQVECFTAFADPAKTEIVATVTDQMILRAKARDLAPDVTVLPQPDAAGSTWNEKYGIGLPNGRLKLCAALNEAVDDFLHSTDPDHGWNAAWRRWLNDLGEQPDSHRPSSTDPC